MDRKKLQFNGKLIAKIGIFTALSFALTFLEFPIFPAAPFLKLDFSNVFVLIGGFSLGTVPGIIILIVKEALCLLKSSTVVGQLANVIIGLCYVLVPFILYKVKRTFPMAVVGMAVGVLLQSGTSLLVNYYVNYPLFLGSVPFVPNAQTIEFFKQTWWAILSFNVIKAVSTAVITLILYKRVKGLLNF